MNPTNILTQSLLISTRSNRSSLKELLDASDYYLIKRSSAEQIIRETYLSVEDWRKQAKVIGIAGAEQERFARRIEYSLDEARKLFPRKTTIVLPSNDSQCVKE